MAKDEKKANDQNAIEKEWGSSRNVIKSDFNEVCSRSDLLMYLSM